MHRQLVLTAIICQFVGGCARNSNAVVAGDPFNAPNQVSSTGALANRAQPRQTVSLDEHRVDPVIPEGSEFQVRTIESDLAEVQFPSPDKSEWWNALPSDTPAAKDGIKVPSQSSVNGRVGSVSMSYGMGQINKP